MENKSGPRRPSVEEKGIDRVVSHNPNVDPKHVREEGDVIAERGKPFWMPASQSSKLSYVLNFDEVTVSACQMSSEEGSAAAAAATARRTDVIEELRRGESAVARSASSA